MFYKCGESPVGITPLSVSQSSLIPKMENPWVVVINSKSKFFIGTEGCSIVDGSFSETSKGGLGSCKLKYSKMDIPLFTEDKVEIFKNGKNKYTGFVRNVPDPNSDSINVDPYSKKFGTALFSTSYFGDPHTFDEVIEDVLNQKSSQLKIQYNASLIDLDSTEVTTQTYEYETVKKTFDDIENQIDNRTWGIDAGNSFYYKKYSTTIDHYIYTDDDPFYKGLKYKIDYNKVKETRNQVYQKSTGDSGDNIYLGEVGYPTSTDFPPLDIEIYTGIKEKKYIAPDGLGSSEALDYAYKRLQSKTEIPENIKIKAYDDSRKEVNLFDKVRIWRPESLLWHTIIDCNSTDNWSAVAVSTFGIRYSTYVISFASSFDSNKPTYLFEDVGVYKSPEKIGFYVYCNEQGHKLRVIISSDLQEANDGALWGEGEYGDGYWGGLSTSLSTGFFYQQIKDIYIETANEWQFIDFDMEFNAVSKIVFEPKSTSAFYLVDNISMKSYHRTYYDGNVIRKSYDLGSDLVDIEVGKFDELLNDDFFELEKEVKKLQDSITI